MLSAICMITSSCVVPYDFNGDGFVDLFIGGRAVPQKYGEIPHSYLLQNDGTGKFTDVTEQYAKDLSADRHGYKCRMV